MPSRTNAAGLSRNIEIEATYRSSADGFTLFLTNLVLHPRND
jgi:hypothetical protein